MASLLVLCLSLTAVSDPSTMRNSSRHGLRTAKLCRALAPDRSHAATRATIANEMPPGTHPTLSAMPARLSRNVYSAGLALCRRALWRELAHDRPLDRRMRALGIESSPRSPCEARRHDLPAPRQIGPTLQGTAFDDLSGEFLAIRNIEGDGWPPKWPPECPRPLGNP